MKKLVCVDEVKAAAARGQKVFRIQCNTIITPAARDLAKELGVEFAEDLAVGENFTCKDNNQQQKNNQSIDKDLIYQIVKAVLAKNLTGSAPEPPFLTEGDPKSGLKIVRGRTVQYDNFDTGTPNTQVAYREVINKDDAKMSAGFLTIEKSSFDWQLCYEEIDIVLEGNLTITINGETFEAYQGDVLFVPKGSQVTWSTSGYVKLFYVTYPANWADLMAH